MLDFAVELQYEQGYIERQAGGEQRGGEPGVPVT
jgi:hypothetical protein